MALNGNHILYNTSTTTTPCAGVPLRRTFVTPSWHWASPKPRNLSVVSATKKLSSARTGRFDSRKRRDSVPTQDEEEEEEEVKAVDETAKIDSSASTATAADGSVMPKLTGTEPDFWEGPQWDGLGFFVQYMWALGVVFALVACGVAVITYNQGATDFKDTPVYKESIQSRELLEDPESSKADVFESNPTEEAPALE